MQLNSFINAPITNIPTPTWFESTRVRRIALVATAALVLVGIGATLYTSLGLRALPAQIIKAFATTLSLTIVTAIAASICLYLYRHPSPNSPEEHARLQRKARQEICLAQLGALAVYQNYSRQLVPIEQINDYVIAEDIRVLNYSQFVEKHGAVQSLVPLILNEENKNALKQKLIRHLVEQQAERNLRSLLKSDDAKALSITAEELAPLHVENETGQFLANRISYLTLLQRCEGGLSFLEQKFREDNTLREKAVKEYLELPYAQIMLHQSSQEMLGITEEFLKQGLRARWKEIALQSPDFPDAEGFFAALDRFDPEEWTEKAVKDTKSLSVEQIATKYPALFQKKVLTLSTRIDPQTTLGAKLNGEIALVETFEEFVYKFPGVIHCALLQHFQLPPQLITSFVQRHPLLYLKNETDFNKDLIATYDMLPPNWKEHIQQMKKKYDRRVGEYQSSVQRVTAHYQLQIYLKQEAKEHSINVEKQRVGLERLQNQRSYVEQQLQGAKARQQLLEEQLRCALIKKGEYEELDRKISHLKRQIGHYFYLEEEIISLKSEIYTTERAIKDLKEGQQRQIFEARGQVRTARDHIESLEGEKKRLDNIERQRASLGNLQRDKERLQQEIAGFESEEELIRLRDEHAKTPVRGLQQATAAQLAAGQYNQRLKALQNKKNELRSLEQKILALPQEDVSDKLKRVQEQLSSAHSSCSQKETDLANIQSLYQPRICELENPLYGKKIRLALLEELHTALEKIKGQEQNKAEIATIEQERAKAASIVSENERALYKAKSDVAHAKSLVALVESAATNTYNQKRNRLLTQLEGEKNAILQQYIVDESSLKQQLVTGPTIPSFT